MERALPWNKATQLSVSMPSDFLTGENCKF